MRKLTFAIALILFSNTSIAQHFRGQKATVSFLQTGIAPSVMDSAFNSSKLYESFRIQGEIAEDFVTSINQAATDSTWEIMSEMLLTDCEMTLNDMDRLVDISTYSAYGYPNALIMKMVAKKDDSPLYVKISAELGQKAETLRKSSGKLDLSSKNTKVFAEITLIFYDANGKKIRKISQIAFAEETIDKYLIIKVKDSDQGGVDLELDNIGILLRKAKAGILAKYLDENYSE